MFAWRGARFEFQPGVEMLDPETAPLSLQAAVLAAAFERDEIARLEIASVDPDASLDVDEERLTQLAE